MTSNQKAPVMASLITFVVAVGCVISCSTGEKSEQRKTVLAASGKSRSAPKITQAMIPVGRYGRHKMSRMTPCYITIHSTQNFSTGANAAAHASLLQRGGLTSRHNSLGYLTWHFTVDENSIYQSLPTSEQGQHADYDGPGNQSSIGIEMCENSGNSRERTLEQTARLTAWLMNRHNIPISHIVPHQHWPRIRASDKKDIGQKNCPHFLMDNGMPGKKWQAFLDEVKSYL